MSVACFQMHTLLSSCQYEIPLVKYQFTKTIKKRRQKEPFASALSPIYASYPIGRIRVN
jgi:hypothetical protein